MDIRLQSGCEYHSESVLGDDPGWSSVQFTTPIVEVHLNLPCDVSGKEKLIVMYGMEQYNFCVEATADMAGYNRISGLMLFGLHPSTITVTLMSIRFGPSGFWVLKQPRTLGTEWAGSSTSGWKRGIPGRPFANVVYV
jgi:hypothetical protein